MNPAGGSGRSSTATGSRDQRISIGAGAGALLAPAPSITRALTRQQSGPGEQQTEAQRERPADPSGRTRSNWAARRLGVVVADGEPLYLEALEWNVRRWPEFELLGTAEGPELLGLLDDVKPTVVVVDHTTIGIDRRELFKRAIPRARLLLIATRPRQAEVYASMAAGVSGYLSKGCPKLELCHTIAALGRGRERLGASLQPAIASEIRLRETRPSEALTDREREILLMMCKGMSAPAMGEALHLGLPTIKTHQHHLFEKLGASERAEAVANAFWRGVLE